MNQQYIIGVDIGTTGAKSAVFTIEGTMVSSAYTEYGCIYPMPLWVEQDAKMLLDAAVSTIKQAIAEAGICKQNIASVGFSVQRSCVVFIDKDGIPLKMISWQDGRSGEEVSAMADVLPENDFYIRSGLPLGTTWILPKLLWVRNKDKELYDKSERIVQLHDYILKEFGAYEYFTPETDVGMSGLWDVDRYKWNEVYIEKFDIDMSRMPKVAKVSDPIGVLSNEMAAATGLPEKLPLGVGVGDQSAAALGAGIIRDGDISVSMGTGGMMIACFDTPKRDPHGAFLVTDHAIHDKWQWEGLQMGSAGTYRWFRDEIASYEKHIAQTEDRDVYDLLGEMVAGVPAGAKGLLVLPYFASSATPHWNNDARGTIIGLTFAHDKACLARAFIEGITMEHKDMLFNLKASGISLNKIRIIGGPTKSEVWNGIQASVYGLPVETLKIADAALLGAAIAGAVGAGVFSSIADGVDNIVQADKIYEPNTVDAKVYDELYSCYCSAYKGLAEDTYSKIAKLQSKYE